MTVKELIKRLESCPQNQTVVTDLHSEFVEVTSVDLITGYDNGGYVSKPYTEEQKLKAHGYVFVGVS